MTTEATPSDLVAPILRSPWLVQLAREIQQTVLADEQRRRDRFVDEVAEGRKAEFINGAGTRSRRSRSTASGNKQGSALER